MTIQKLSDGTYKVKDAEAGVPDIKAKYESKMRGQYGDVVTIVQNGKNVKVYFATKRIGGSMSFGPSNYKSEPAYVEARRIYDGLKKKIGFKALKSWSLLKEGKRPNGVAAWEGGFSLK